VDNVLENYTHQSSWRMVEISPVEEVVGDLGVDDHAPTKFISATSKTRDISFVQTKI